MTNPTDYDDELDPRVVHPVQFDNKGDLFDFRPQRIFDEVPVPKDLSAPDSAEFDVQPVTPTEPKEETPPPPPVKPEEPGQQSATSADVEKALTEAQTPPAPNTPSPASSPEKSTKAGSSKASA